MTYIKIDHYIVDLGGIRAINHLSPRIIILYEDKTEVPPLEFADEQESKKAFEKIADALGAM